MHEEQNQLLGCHIELKKRIVGGLLGKSHGNTNSALKIPPSLQLINNVQQQLGRIYWTLHHDRPLKEIQTIFQSNRNAFWRI